MMIASDSTGDEHSESAEESQSVWKRVARAAKSRRLELGMTQQDAAEQAGLSLATWRLVESAGRDRYQELTQHGVCRALGWRHDAFDLLTDPDTDKLDLDDLVESSAKRPLPSGDPVPSGLAHNWAELTPHEQSRVQGFVEGLIASRRR